MSAEEDTMLAELCRKDLRLRLVALMAKRIRACRFHVTHGEDVATGLLGADTPEYGRRLVMRLQADPDSLGFALDEIEHAVAAEDGLDFEKVDGDFGRYTLEFEVGGDFAKGDMIAGALQDLKDSVRAAVLKRCSEAGRCCEQDEKTVTHLVMVSDLVKRDKRNVIGAIPSSVFWVLKSMRDIEVAPAGNTFRSVGGLYRVKVPKELAPMSSLEKGDPGWYQHVRPLSTGSKLSPASKDTSGAQYLGSSLYEERVPFNMSDLPSVSYASSRPKATGKPLAPVNPPMPPVNYQGRWGALMLGIHQNRILNKALLDSRAVESTA